MIHKDFISLYTSDGFIQTIAEKIKPNEKQRLQLKGLSGSLDAVIITAIYQLCHQNYLFILHDREEAAYFQNDLQNLIPEREILLFPSSYKKPYDVEETDNANVLFRTEILNRINHKDAKGELIVTYPEALIEKVINKRSLLQNTLTLKTGNRIQLEKLIDKLIFFDFEKTDFVFEAGQFSVRGGILDIFSYANELPYRIELFDDDIESIRVFDPDTQLSVANVKEIHLIPNIDNRLLEEARDSFLSFLPANTKVFFKDYDFTLDVIQKQFDKSKDVFQEILKKSGHTQVILSPSDIFETSISMKDSLNNFTCIEFGNRFYLKGAESFEIPSQGQPSFNKNFELLGKNLEENQDKGYLNIFSAGSESQIERLTSIFEEINPFVSFRSIPVELRSGFVDHHTKVALYTDHQLFERYHRYATKHKYTKTRALTLRELQTLQPGDYVTHIDYGIGRFVGLDKVEINGKEQETLRLIYKDDDLLYVGVQSLHKISKYTGREGKPPVMSKLGSQEWDQKKKRVKSKVKDIAKDLILLYAKRKASPGFSFSRDSFMQAELESSFIYEDTPDQAKSTNDVKDDMERPHPMDRLVCGDVGFGKTEVAIRAAFKAVSDNKQVAVLVPTTILAFQHFRTFTERLADFPVKIEYISRFKSAKSIRQTITNLSEGQTNIVIGTHRLVNKDIVFKDLGLLIIDEEQKFGVSVKEKLKQIRVNVDTLTLTATPIPRTLHFSLMGARDLSIIATAPSNRQPVTTEIHNFNEGHIRDAISYELRRGGQVFFVHNQIKDIDEVANIVFRLVPDARIAIAHGQMLGEKLERIMLKFIEGEYDILVSTNIIESGLDIPNANTIIINRAHMFGLSDLHQMRGRVGRSNRKAFCYLLTPPVSKLTVESRKRLKTLEEFSELGDGFKVAMRDLDIRGAGNLLGGEQSGFINDLGFETYHKILDESVQELKETEFRELFGQNLQQKTGFLAEDCTIETDFEMLIPESYVSNISERLNLYARLDNIKNEDELVNFINEIRDRFGEFPESVKTLIETVQIRWLAEQLGIEKLVIKNGTLKAQFLDAGNEDYYKSEIFGKILTFINANPRKCQLKEIKNKPVLIIQEILQVKDAKKTLENIN
ncbi:MAG: transcription-repair coupling factor [Cyclobacteriaceae bacterium]|nr:transcription-repair coupling factor [Cyclobacteriaceae bacterium]